MTRTVTLAPGAAHAAKAQQTDGAAKGPHAKASLHKAAVAPSSPHQHAPHHHPSHHHAPDRHPARRGLVAGALVLVAASAAGLWWLAGGGEPAVDPGAQLQAQMEAAAQGTVVPTHAFGGTLSVVQANGRLNVVAEGVPSRACVQVGWRLARSGTIIVNGTLPTRLSAAKLSDLCSGDGASLMWVPDQ